MLIVVEKVGNVFAGILWDIYNLGVKKAKKKRPMNIYMYILIITWYTMIIH